VNFWDSEIEYGKYFHKIATGELPEMECSKAICKFLSPIYASEKKVLDVACGSGHYLRSFLERIDSNIDYTGIDATKFYIELAQKAFPQKGVFKLGNIFNIPFSDETFDIVMANNVLLHLPPNPTQALKELVRVSREHIIIRTTFGERNYVIQEVRESSENKNLYVEDKPTESNYFNLYTEDYFRKVFSEINPSLKVKITKDESFKNFDTRDQTNNKTGTKTVNGVQQSGNIILDWRFLIISK
tara:strand:- start:1669 stop:2397 length:729 start_codon:yes stop_codon:yes gene_type:complete